LGHSLKYPFDTSATPFEPDLDAAPNDFGIAITYPTSLNTHVGSAESVAVDGNGNIWITNRYNPGLGGNSAAPGASTLVELTTAGVAISPPPTTPTVASSTILSTSPSIPPEISG